MLIPECKDDDETKVFCNCSALNQLSFEPVGRWYEACLKRQRSEKSVSMSEEIIAKQDEEEEESNGALTEDDKAFMLSLDAKEWKKQDHYRVLGLSKKRWQCTDEDVKKAYRKMVLKYHPDKRKVHSTELPPGLKIHDYFTCITRAFETLSTKEGRQAFDSVDPEFSDDVPSYNSKQNFFKVFDAAFKANSRWSEIQPVPLLGDKNTNQEDVNDFYAFWYDFKSWRTFAYEDDEEKGETREERRWYERENRRVRQKKKKDEILRIRALVDKAFQNDPRIKKFKDVEKQKKLDEKLAREQEEKEKEKQRQIVLEEERKLKEKTEQEAKEKEKGTSQDVDVKNQAAKEKKEKDKVKKAAARDRKVVRQAIKAEKFFNLDSDEISALDRLEKSMENLSLQNLQELREVSEAKDTDKLRELYTQYSNIVMEKIRKQQEEQRKKDEQALIATKQNSTSNSTTDQVWNEDELKLLVKASQLFAVGTASRWEVIANYINEHSGSEKKKNAKQVINKVKSLKKLDPSLKEEVNKMAFKNLEKTTNAKLASATPSPTDAGKTISPATESVSTPWSSDEQKLLEQALKKYNSSTPERWEKISSDVPTRTKKECMKRYKELVDMVKAKKAAAAQQK